MCLQAAGRVWKLLPWSLRQTRAGFSSVIKLENGAPAHKESTGFLADPQHQQLQHRPHSTDPHCA